jgi:hypothetical protein
MMLCVPTYEILLSRVMSCSSTNSASSVGASLRHISGPVAGRTLLGT